ncbi:hypothetical protein JZ751_029761 [Albula glossodonta]|uniref:Neurotrypsin n=1 Tax=Albula glossodonta TaxID=121402 RepID=A0A8T2N9K6_9TELE|nr:hypothetical protein JZ751_029761 [Albula glossodonta]
MSSSLVVAITIVVFGGKVCLGSDASSFILPFTDCIQSKGKAGYYQGSIDVTESGAKCMNWGDVAGVKDRYPGKGLGDHNFCRNPDGRIRPWCFFRNNRGRIDWGYCDCKQGSVRLQGGRSKLEGTVEVYLNGAWGAICSNSWGHEDAAVVCRQLGQGYKGRARYSPLSRLSFSLVHWSSVQCRGHEDDLLQCPNTLWNGGECANRQVAAVTCTLQEATVFVPVRLVGGGSGFEGRVEVYHAGHWGTVCDDQWDDADAEAYFGEGSGRVLLDEVQCTGNELSIEQCPKNPWGEHNCEHREDAGVSCTPLTGKEPALSHCDRREWRKHDCTHKEDVSVTCTPERVTHGVPASVPLRLVGGETAMEGRVEIYINGQWGTICDDGWTDRDADVVCRQLGYTGVSKARTMAYFGEGEGPIHVDNVKCTGSERSLADCIKQPIGTHNCRHTEDAGVICNYGQHDISDVIKDPIALVCGLRLAHTRQKRIIGGENSLSCWVLTSAHCFKRYGNSTKTYKVRVGDYHTLVPEEFEAEYGVEEIVPHPNYRPHSNDYDLALVRLSGRDDRCAVLSRHVLPACLPLRRERVLKVASNCFITGWGDTGRAYSKTLQQASISLLNKRHCEASYPGQFTGRMLCAGNAQEEKWVDSCRGDSGGPLVCERPTGGWVVYGVTSWGHACRLQDSPGVYTKVSAFVPWVRRVAGL